MKKSSIIKSLIFIFLLNPLINGCQAKPKVDQYFLQEFSEGIRPQVHSLCERYDSNDEFNGIYYSEYALGIYTLIGLKNNKFSILSFTDQQFLVQENIKDISFQTGTFSKNKNWIILETEKNMDSDLNVINNFDRLYYLRSPTEIFLIKDLEDVAISTSWSKTMGDERSHFKKINCSLNFLKKYKGEDEPAPEYKILPEQLKAMVIETPLHLKIHWAEDIKDQLKENDDPETAVEQHIKLFTPEAQKLFKNQPVCILKGQGKGWIGYIDQPSQPYTSAWISVYSFDLESSVHTANQGDVISTSQKECESFD